MELIKTIKSLLGITKKKPLLIDVWYNSNVYNKVDYPKVWDKDGEYIEAKVGNEYVMKEDEEGQHIYKIIDMKCRTGDYLHDSDGIRCVMEYVRTVKPKQ